MQLKMPCNILLAALVMLPGKGFIVPFTLFNLGCIGIILAAYGDYLLNFSSPITNDVCKSGLFYVFVVM